MTIPRWLLAALPLLGACPIPQPLVEVSRTGTSNVVPPRILNDPGSLSPTATAVTYDPSCPTPQAFDVAASVGNENTEEVVDYRWFVDYRAEQQARYTPVRYGALLPPVVQPLNVRPVPAFAFQPAGFGAGPHVLELVVSNGFAGTELTQDRLALPWRTAAAGFEVQAFRWVFVAAPGSGGCPP